MFVHVSGFYCTIWQRKKGRGLRNCKKKNWTQEGRKGKDFWPQGEKEIFLKKKKNQDGFYRPRIFF